MTLGMTKKQLRRELEMDEYYDWIFYLNAVSKHRAWMQKRNAFHAGLKRPPRRIVRRRR